MESWWERAFLEFSLPHWAKEHVIQGHKTIFPLNQIILKSHFIKIHEVLGFFFLKKNKIKITICSVDILITRNLCSYNLNCTKGKNYDQVQIIAHSYMSVYGKLTS